MYIKRFVSLLFNSPAPIQITVDDNNPSIKEGEHKSIFVTARHFSEHDIDIYDFDLILEGDNSILSFDRTNPRNKSTFLVHPIAIEENFL